MVKRAQSCLPVDFRYSLGCGGWDPKDALPATLVWRRPKGKFLPVKALWCDCSGFISWVIGLSRRTTIHPKLWGISTTSIHRDATEAGCSRYFRLLAPGESPEAGDFIVYPDKYDPIARKTKQGHVALIVEPASRTVIDCSSSVDGISRRVAGFWGKSTVVRFDPVPR